MKGLLATPLRSVLNVLQVFVFAGAIGSTFAQAPPAPVVSVNQGDQDAVLWESTATWIGGVVPVAGDNVIIEGAWVEFTNSSSNIDVGSITLNSLGYLDMKGGTLTVSDVITVSQSAMYASGGKVILDGSYSSGGQATVQGSNNVTFYDVEIPTGGSVDFGAGGSGVAESFVTNSLTLGGGSVVVNAPTYSSNSTLIYGASYTVGPEWTADATSGKGVPYDVQVVSGATLSFGSATGNYLCSNDLDITGSGSLNMGTMAGDLTVSGNMTVTGSSGSMNMATMAGDLKVTGTCTIGGVSGQTVALTLPTAEGMGSLDVTGNLILGVTGETNLTISGDEGNINAAADFTVYASNAEFGVVTFDGGAVQTFAGEKITVDELQVANTNDESTGTADVVLSGSIDVIAGGLFNPTDGTVNANSKLTMKSGSAGTARIGTLDNSGAGSDVIGDITFERFIPQFSTTSASNWSGNSWLAIGNYVTGATLSDWTSSYNSGSGLYVTEYDETHAEAQTDVNNGANAWTFLSSGTDVLESTGLGYYAFTFGSTGDQTLSATGGYNTSDQSETLTYSNGANEGGGWHLLANPFPSPIDGATFISDNALVDGYYVLDNNNSKYVNSSEVLASGTIDVGQSFWVLIPSAGTVTFNTTQISATSGTFVREDDIALQGTVGLRISQEDGRSGQTYVRMHEEGLPEYQFGLDVYYRPATDASNPEVWSVADGDFELLFNAMGDIESTTVVPLNVRSGSEGTVTLEWDSSFPMPEGVCALIEDLETGNVEALGGDPMVVALEANTVYADRFQLTFMNTPVFESSVSHCGGGVIHFNGDESELWNINWSTVSGDLDGTGCASGLESGDYVLEAINEFTQCQVHSTLSIPEVCLGDFNLNGGRDITDLLILLVGLQPTNELAANEFLATDCDCDGAMTTSDLLLFLPYFGTGCN